MSGQVVLITGAAGFLGSATAVALSRDYRVIALDRRKPTRALIDAAPDVLWRQADVADAPALAAAFAGTRRSVGRIDFVVHFAAYYHFGSTWRRQYQRTNIRGTDNALRLAREHGATRLIFASSVAAMQPLEDGQRLVEHTPTADYIPYARSKSIGERMVREAADRLPAIVLRIGGAFSDWCELPPLYALIKLWAGRAPLNHVVVGRGRSGFPFIHRNDVVRMIRCCIERHRALNQCEVFLACQDGTVTHRQLFSAIRDGDEPGTGSEPIHVSPSAAKLGVCLKRAFGCLVGRLPYEHPWMLEYVDRPWVVDTSYTQSRLGWSCAKGMGVLERLPVILDRFRRHRRVWEHRNRRRNRRQYDYGGFDAQEA